MRALDVAVLVLEHERPGALQDAGAAPCEPRGVTTARDRLAARLDPETRQAVTTAAWYRKPHPTFADTLATVCRQFWQEQGFFTSHPYHPSI